MILNNTARNERQKQWNYPEYTLAIYGIGARKRAVPKFEPFKLRISFISKSLICLQSIFLSVVSVKCLRPHLNMTLGKQELARAHFMCSASVSNWALSCYMWFRLQSEGPSRLVFYRGCNPDPNPTFSCRNYDISFTGYDVSASLPVSNVPFTLQFLLCSRSFRALCRHIALYSIHPLGHGMTQQWTSSDLSPIVHPLGPCVLL